jgi:hypothetical protein
MKSWFLEVLLVCFVCSLLVHLTSASSKPNIVLFLVDDLGIGDVPCFGKLDFFISYSMCSPIFPCFIFILGVVSLLTSFHLFLYLEPLHFLKFLFV